MSLVEVSASLHFSAHRYALKWAEEHLPEHEYEQINRSYAALLKRTFAFVVFVCLPIIVVCMLVATSAPVSRAVEKASAPDGATGYVIARVDYDGNFY